MPTDLTSEFIAPYINKGKRHKSYTETCKIASDIKVHSDGENAGDLIDERRPSESEAIKNYRKKIFVAITEPVISKIITALGKIRRSSDWAIKYDKSKIPGTIIEDETPEKYFEENYPVFGSVTKWVFDVLLKSYIVDPNSVILIMADKSPDTITYKKPIAIIFDSEHVYDFVEDEYAILYSTDKSEYKLDNGMVMDDGDVIYAINSQVIQRWEQINSKKDMSLASEFKHDLGKMPAFKVGGLIYKTKDKAVIYKSRISPTIPHLKEAVREYSDLQAEVVQHIHSEKWTYQTQKCSICSGLGKINSESKIITCTECKGQGTVPTSPYSVVTMQLPKIGEQPIPGGVPMGYVQKQIDIVKIQDERVDKHKYQALSAINMEFLAEVPMAQSGVAKNVDRDELNTFVYSIAEDIVALMDKIYAFAIDLRYDKTVPNGKQRKFLRPNISVPQNFDLLSSDYLLKELKSAKDAKLNPVTLIALEVEYACKKFNNEPLVRDELKAVLELDPLPGITEDEKLLRLQNDGIEEADYVLSCNIYSFVRKAIDEDKNFLTYPLKEKKKVMEKYAQEVIRKNSSESGIMEILKEDNKDAEPK